MTKSHFPQPPTSNRLSPVLDPVLDAIRSLLSRQERVLVAIDGRCGAGKTTLAARLQAEFPCRVFHMDDFFLQPYQRTPERLQAPGENVDHERFLQEVLLPAARGEAVVYRPYLCAHEVLGPAVFVPPARLTIVEGSYACHPALWPYYHLRIFLTVDPREQLRRIEARSGPEKLRQFIDRWIPLEEQYFQAYSLAERCDFFLGV